LTDEALPPLLPYLYGRECGTNERVYTADQMHEYGRAVERAAYTAAIKACRQAADTCVHPDECVEAIEALMTQEQPE